MTEEKLNNLREVRDIAKSLVGIVPKNKNKRNRHAQGYIEGWDDGLKELVSRIDEEIDKMEEELE